MNACRPLCDVSGRFPPNGFTPNVLPSNMAGLSVHDLDRQATEMTTPLERHWKRPTTRHPAIPETTNPPQKPTQATKHRVANIHHCNRGTHRCQSRHGWDAHNRRSDTHTASSLEEWDCYITAAMNHRRRFAPPSLVPLQDASSQGIMRCQGQIAPPANPLTGGTRHVLASTSAWAHVVSLAMTDEQMTAGSCAPVHEYHIHHRTQAPARNEHTSRRHDGQDATSLVVVVVVV
jgi:hypothetical protein